MATLIQLTFPQRRNAPAVQTTSAQIIIFPGVRYERAQTRPVESALEKPKRKRKTRAKVDKQIVVAR